MEHYHIKLSNQSIQTWQSNYLYIKYNLYNSMAATNFYLKFIKKLGLLKNFPLAFQKIENSNYRRLIFDKWIIIYEVIENIVIIQYVFYSRQDYLENI